MFINIGRVRGATDTSLNMLKHLLINNLELYKRTLPNEGPIVHTNALIANLEPNNLRNS